MGARNKTGQKSEEQLKAEIIEDWADVRRWIDELQTEWAERQNTGNPSRKGSPKQKRRSSSGK